MMTSSRLIPRGSVLGALVVGCWAVTVSTQGAFAQQQDVAGQSSINDFNVRKVQDVVAPPLKKGERARGDIPFAAPVIVDYRDGSSGPVKPRAQAAGSPTGNPCQLNFSCNDCDTTTVDTCSGGVCAVTAGVTAAPGDFRLAGFGCDNDDDCEGQCNGGILSGADCVDEAQCCGGTVCFGGGADDGASCSDNADCDSGKCGGQCDGNGAGVGEGTSCGADGDCGAGGACQGIVANGSCDLFLCDTTGFETTDRCVNASIPPQIDPATCTAEFNPVDCCTGAGTGTCVFDANISREEIRGICDDGLECNGEERVILTGPSAGFCVPGVGQLTDTFLCTGGDGPGGNDDRDGEKCDPNAEDPDNNVDGCPGVTICEEGKLNCEDNGQQCDEQNNSCIDLCEEDADCERDSLFCRAINDTVTGIDACDLATGLCIALPNPCGPGGGCAEPVGGGTDVICGPGRCCTEDVPRDFKDACTGGSPGSGNEVKFDECDGADQVWLGTDDACSFIQDGTDETTILNDCPVYGSGVAVAGDRGIAVGPISGFAPCAGTILELGDDYNVESGTAAFISVGAVRWVASVQSSSRFVVSFYDKTGLFIENIFFPTVGVDITPRGPTVFTVLFDPVLIVAAEGIMTISNEPTFAPTGTISWLVAEAQTDGLPVLTAYAGFNDPAKLAIRGTSGVLEIRSDNFLGECQGGDRDLQWCDVLDVNCPNGGTCVGISSVMSFEILADQANDPQGGCCVTSGDDGGMCNEVLPWECLNDSPADAGENVFRGIGVKCAICLGGDNDNDPCTSNLQCTGGGICSESICVTEAGAPQDPTVSCLFDNECDVGNTCKEIASCTVQACCYPTIQDCVDAAAIGGDDDSSCPCLEIRGIDNTCPGAGGETSGFGTTCDPNCCPIDQNEFRTVVNDGDQWSGGDSCPKVFIHQIEVPTSQGVTKTLTLTGNSSNATFDDCENGICDGGPNDGANCTVADQDTICPSACDTGPLTDSACATDRECGQCATGLNMGDPCTNADPKDCSTCADGPVADAACATDSDCGECAGGTNVGGSCTEAADCPNPNETCGGNDECEAGANVGNACNSDFDCPPDSNSTCNVGTCGIVTCDVGTCDTGTCNNFNGGVFCTPGDPGWWEGFSIDKCADIRLDFCCTEPVLRPSWSGLWQGCPTIAIRGSIGVPPPIGLGYRDSNGGGRGSGFCDAGDDNSIGTFGIRPPGIYYKPANGNVGASFAPLINLPEGSPPLPNYQMHITVGACQESACCSILCVGGDRDLEPCNPTPFVACPGTGECIAGFCSTGDLHGSPCTETSVDQCPGGGVCGGVSGDVSGCAISNELVCNTAAGFWMNGLNLPERACRLGANNGVSCEENTDCDSGDCALVTVQIDCGGGGSTPCDIGACCAGPNQCDDTISQFTAFMDEAACGNDQFIGGVQCEFPGGTPCPICSLSGPDFCTRANGGFVFTMDRNLGSTPWDDFEASGTGIKEFCWFSEYSDGGFDNACTVVPQPNFDINFYNDSGGIPTTKLAGSPGNLGKSGFYQLVDGKAVEGECTPGVDCDFQFIAEEISPATFNRIQFALIFEPGREVVVSPFVTYWVEFGGTGDPSDSCFLWTFNSLDGNNYSFYPDSRTDDPALNVLTFNDRTPMDSDWAWCLDTGGGATVTDGPRAEGACCKCDGSCVRGPFDDCVAQRDENFNFPPDIPDPPGLFVPGEGCPAQGGTAVCPIGPTGACPDVGGVTRHADSCQDPIIANTEVALELIESTDPLTDEMTIKERFNVGINNLCTTTDGRTGFPGAVKDVDFGAFVNDVWVQYTATCGGEVEFELCNDANFDIVYMIFQGPATGAEGIKECLGPDQCRPSLGDAITQATDGECNNGPAGPSFLKAGVKEGDCFLIRVGADGGGTEGAGEAFSGITRGTASLRITCETKLCTPAGPPLPLLVKATGGGTGPLSTTRTLNFTVPDLAGLESAIRIELKEIPANLLASNPPGNIPDSFLGLVGSQMWVGAEPVDTESLCSIPSIGFGGLCPVCVDNGTGASGVACTLPGGAECSAEETCTRRETIELTNLSQEAAFLDWSTRGGLIISTGELDPGRKGELHVYGTTVGAGANFIFPGAVYEVTVLVEGCDPEDPESFSPPIELGGLEPGDVVGSFDQVSKVWTVPGDGASIASDVPALLSAFKGVSTAPNKARMDIQGTNALQRAQLDGIIGLNDVNDGIDGFKGRLYRFGPGLCTGGGEDGKRGCDPCDAASKCIADDGVCTFDCPAVTCPSTPITCPPPSASSLASR